MKFFIPGNPIGKGRPRSVVRGGYVSHYTPKKTRAEETRLRTEAKIHGPDVPYTGPLAVNLRFQMPIPKQTTKKQRALIESGLSFHTKKPDLDNLIKLILDALNEVIWQDDKQIVRLTTEKEYDNQPGIWVEVTEL